MRYVNNFIKIVTRIIPLNINLIEYLFKNGLIVKNTYYDLLTELILKDVLESDSVCIDVGCHLGSILQLMIKYAPEGKFIAFEPIPKLYNTISNKFKRSNVNIYNYALSDSKGSASFNYVTSNPGYSGLIKRKYDRPDETDVTIEVQIETLDNILELEKVGSVSFIKIDVEGAEYLVLKGAKKTIQRYKPVIVFEHGLGASDCYKIGPDVLYEFLCNDCRLKISLLPDWLLNKQSLTLSEFCEQYHLGKNFYFIAHK